MDFLTSLACFRTSYKSWRELLARRAQKDRLTHTPHGKLPQPVHQRANQDPNQKVRPLTN